MHIDDTLPGTDDREFCAGMTGTGKTTFIMKQLEAKKKESVTLYSLSSMVASNGKVKKLYPMKGYICEGFSNTRIVFPLRSMVRQNLTGLDQNFSMCIVLMGKH